MTSKMATSVTAIPSNYSLPEHVFVYFLSCRFWYFFQTYEKLENLIWNRTRNPIFDQDWWETKFLINNKLSRIQLLYENKYAAMPAFARSPR